MKTLKLNYVTKIEILRYLYYELTTGENHRAIPRSHASYSLKIVLCGYTLC